MKEYKFRIDESHVAFITVKCDDNVTYSEAKEKVKDRYLNDEFSLTRTCYDIDKADYNDDEADEVITITDEEL